MKAWARIIVEQLHGHWSAWFGDRPHKSFGGAFPTDAIRRLLDATGEQFDTTEILEASDREGHLEFFIAYRHRVLMPVPSRN